jgi:hypothetical protein
MTLTPRLSRARYVARRLSDPRVVTTRAREATQSVLDVAAEWTRRRETPKPWETTLTLHVNLDGVSGRTSPL